MEEEKRGEVLDEALDEAQLEVIEADWQEAVDYGSLLKYGEVSRWIPKLIATVRARTLDCDTLKAQLASMSDLTTREQKEHLDEIPGLRARVAELEAEAKKEATQSKQIIAECVARIDPDPNGCRCWDCLKARGVDIWWFHVCPKCGCKRCPHATNHVHGCTQSNLSGQPGSRFK